MEKRKVDFSESLRKKSNLPRRSSASQGLSFASLAIAALLIFVVAFTVLDKLKNNDLIRKRNEATPTIDRLALSAGVSSLACGEYPIATRPNKCGRYWNSTFLSQDEITSLRTLAESAMRWKQVYEAIII
jgi:hypothetical protein